VPRPRKQFGQHWLRSEKVLRSIVEAAELVPGDRVLEIGPGRGALTQLLVETPATIMAVEVDQTLYPELHRKFDAYPNFTLLEKDILQVDLATEFGALHLPHPNKVVANIPYNITGPILEKVLGAVALPLQPAFTSLVLLLQKEVAQRITSPPGSKIYGALSVNCQYLADCEWICTVPAKAFYPAPKVESAVIRLRPRPYPHPVLNPGWLAQLIRAGFQTRRKMLRNNLKTLVPDAPLADILIQVGATPESRAEELSVLQWVKLCQALPPLFPVHPSV
jgi:16S rRNA (adenine1518-N6/adenine1519-N6)-dimethyltransferase